MADAPQGWISAVSNGRFDLTFVCELAIAQKDVWAAVATEAGLANWLSEAKIDLRPRGLFRLWGQCAVEGEVLEVSEPALFRWTWPHADHPDSEVRISVQALGEAASRLTLVQTELPEQHLTDVAAGWHTHLEALPSAALGVHTPFDTHRAAMHYRRYRAAFRTP